MLIQVNTDSQIPGTIELTKDVEAIVRDKFARHASRITRAEIHLNDENGLGKVGGNDKRCMIEVRIAGMDPISATHFAPSHDAALRGAMSKMQSQMDTIFGKMGRG